MNLCENYTEDVHIVGIMVIMVRVIDPKYINANDLLEVLEALLKTIKCSGSIMSIKSLRFVFFNLTSPCMDYLPLLSMKSKTLK